MRELFEKWEKDGPPDLREFVKQFGQLNADLEELQNLLDVANKKKWPAEIIAVIKAAVGQLDFKKRIKAKDQSEEIAKVAKIRADSLDAKRVKYKP